MELKIGAAELARALGRSQGIVEKKSTMPILSHVLLEARKGNVLHVSATDLDLSVSSEHAAEVTKEGALAVPAKHLYEIVRALPELQVTLKKSGNNYLEIKSGASEFRIVGLPAEDFPALPKFERVSGPRQHRRRVTPTPRHGPAPRARRASATSPPSVRSPRRRVLPGRPRRPRTPPRRGRRSPSGWCAGSSTRSPPRPSPAARGCWCWWPTPGPR